MDNTLWNTELKVGAHAQNLIFLKKSLLSYPLNEKALHITI